MPSTSSSVYHVNAINIIPAAISHKFDARFRIGTPGREHSTHLSTQFFGIRQLRPGFTRPSKAIEHQTDTNRPLDALVALAGAGCRELLLLRDSQSVRETPCV